MRKHPKGAATARPCLSDKFAWTPTSSTRTCVPSEFEKLVVGFICGGRFYGDIKAMIETLPEAAFEHLFGMTDGDVWQCFEFGDRRQSLAILLLGHLMATVAGGEEWLLSGSRPGTIVYTNFGMGGVIDQQLRKVGRGYMAEANAVVYSSHQRVADGSTLPRDPASPVIPTPRDELPSSSFYSRRQNRLAALLHGSSSSATTPRQPAFFPRFGSS